MSDHLDPATFAHDHAEQVAHAAAKLVALFGPGVDSPERPEREDSPALVRRLARFAALALAAHEAGDPDAASDLVWLAATARDQLDPYRLS